MSFEYDVRGRLLPETIGIANAKLIACAPEMLDMLERVLTAKFSCDEIKQLIKKATS